MSKLLSEISQLRKLSPELIQKMYREISYTTIDWKEEYSDYQTSGWKTASLINPTGDDQSAIVEDGRGIETKLLQNLPTIKSFLNDLDLNFFIVRVANLSPSSYLWEHRDYSELGDAKKIRLHVPLTTNSKSSLIIDNTKIFMNVGYIWKLDPTSPHGVCNRGKSNRIHLILDCYMDEKYKSEFEEEYLDERYCSQLKRISTNELIGKTKSLIKLNFFDTAEKLILKTYHSSFQKEGYAYDLIIKIYNELGMNQREDSWRNKKRTFLAIS